MDTEAGGTSRAGAGGSHNEDAFLVEAGLGLYVVCDGDSRRPGGEIAANAAAAAIEDFVADAEEQVDLRVDRAVRALVAEAMRRARGAVEAAERADPTVRGLETTITMLLTWGERGVIGHCGDSRAYLLRRGRVHQLTVDHEITTGLFSAAAADDLDVFGLDLEPRDTIVLCTDGAEEVLRDRTILRSADYQSPRMLAHRIVGEAHRQRPELDATAVIVRICSEDEPGWLSLSTRPRETTFGHALEHA